MRASRDEFRRSARDLLAAADQIKRARALGLAAAEAAPAFERAMWQRLADAGWLSIAVPELDGGLGLGLPEIAAVAHEVGRQLLPEPFVAAGVQPVVALCQLPPSELRTRLLSDVCAGRAIVGLAWQEELGQLEPAPGSLLAERHGEQLILHGSKRFVMPAAGADGWLLCARAGEQPLLLWLPATAPDLLRHDEARFDGSAMTRLTCAGTRLPASHVLVTGNDALCAIRDATDSARIAQGAELLGIARRALELLLEHVNTRRQFGQTLGSFQALQHRIVDAYIQCELGESCIDDALQRLARGQLSLAAAASRIKARAVQAALGMTRLAIQLHGALGYSDEHSIGLYFKRTLCVCSWLGGEAAHRRRYFEQTREREREPDDRLASGNPPAPPAAPRDADWDAMSEAEFRRMVRGFLVRHYPQHLRHMPYRVHWPEIKAWYQTLARQGWIAPAWPKALGGMALPPDKLIAFIEEQEQYGVARPPDQGLVMLGPVLMRFGSEQQRQRFLPKILSGEHVWCQGYSEPNAGSDLAALQTEALRDGDSFVVTGQKTWTTLAQDATHMFLLVRTDKTGKKQHGISFLLVELSSPGISVRPIKNIAGDEEFCEVFFDRVRVPSDQLVGDLNQGWSISKTLLGFERLFGGSPKNAQYALLQLEQLARVRGLLADAEFVARYAGLQLDVADLAAAYAAFAAIVRAGGNLPPEVSLLKIWATETHERIARLLAESAAEYGGSERPVELAGAEQRVLSPWINALGATIFSGSNEIQRNILARQVLGLEHTAAGR